MDQERTKNRSKTKNSLQYVDRGLIVGSTESYEETRRFIENKNDVGKLK